VIVSDNSAEGVFSIVRVTLRDARVTGNALGGVVSFGTSRSALTIIRSTVTGNDAQGVADLLSQIKPRVRSSTRGSSLDGQAQVPWGVCSND
jgi:hypothetical protein